MIEKTHPNKNKLLQNFSCCSNWEEKYLYIIELGEYLSPFPEHMRTKENLISGCQSRVWIFMEIDNNNGKIAKLYGDSDAAIVKGLVYIVFTLYNNMTLKEIIAYDAYQFFRQLSFTRYLTPSRSQGLGTIIRNIQHRAIKHLDCDFSL